MRRPFQKLVEMVDELNDTNVTIGELSERWGETTGRIMDAIDALRMLRGEQTYIPTGDK